MRFLQLLAAVALLAAIPAVSHAQYGFGPGFGFGGFGGGWGGGYYTGGMGYVPPPPYYSVYPPVYYSHQIIRRPYGISPYAAWPAPFTPITTTAQRREYSAAVLAESAPAPEPLVIVNPFVVGSEDFKPASTAAEVAKPKAKPETLPAPGPAPTPAPMPPSSDAPALPGDARR